MIQDDELRELKLEDVAAYLKCDPRLLRILLRRLAKNNSGIEYDPGEAAAITKAVRCAVSFELVDPGDEVKELEALFNKQDNRKQTKRGPGEHA
jgi:hypothetical protein